MGATHSQSPRRKQAGAATKVYGDPNNMAPTKESSHLPPFMSADDILIHPSSPPVPSKAQAARKNGLDRLPPELWYRIIPLLRKKVGPVGFRSDDPEDYMQRDLCNAMRVCQLFYSIAGPVLYTRVITNNPSLLFSGINRTPKKSNRLSKLELLGYVRRLDLCYTRLEVQGIDAMKTRFPGYERTSLITYGLANGVKLVVWDMESAEKAAAAIYRTRNRTGVPVLPRLEALTTGAFGEKPELEWDLDYRAIPDNLYPKGHRFRPRPVTLLKKNLAKTADHKQLIYQLSLDASPSHLCTNDSHGPYAYKNPRYNGGLTSGSFQAPRTYTTHIYPRQVAEDMLVHIVQNTLNRWVIDYTYFTSYPDELVGQKCADLYSWLGRRLSSALEMVDRLGHRETRIEVYGALDTDTARCAWLAGVWANQYDWDDDWTREQEIAEIHREVELPRGLERIKLMEGGSGGCPACGYCSF